MCSRNPEMPLGSQVHSISTSYPKIFPVSCHAQLLAGTIAMICVVFIVTDTCAELLAARKKIIKNYCHFYHRFKWKTSAVTSGCPREPN